MAPQNWYNAVVILSCISLYAESAQTKVEVTSPVYPVSVGGILAIQCEVWNMQDAQRINLYHVLKDGDTEELTTKGEYDTRSSLGQRGFLATRTFTGRSNIIILTVIDVRSSDEGEYLCKVYSLIRGEQTNIVQDIMAIKIKYFPSKPYPTCYGAFDKLQVASGKRLVYSCTSAKGFPVVALNWICVNSDVYFTTQESSDGDILISKLSVTVDESYNGASFECKMTSSGFSDRVRSCSVGPLEINPRKRTHLNVKNKQVYEEPDVFKDEICGTHCTQENEFTFMYLAVAMVGITILMLVFLTTMIIYCYKYFAISREVVEPGNSFSSCDGSDAIYVSLQRRHEPDRISLYMSVEDPNNTGNKVLVPREVVDDFYKSLSLKKKSPRY